MGRAFVTHRWNPPEGAPIPQRGDVIVGRKDHWEVLETIPVESLKYPNAWRARLRRLGPHPFGAFWRREAIDRGWWIYGNGNQDDRDRFGP